MRQLTLWLFLCLMGTSALAAQDEETLISGKIESGGFGALVWKLTEINGETAIMGGGRGGWIINHTFVIGAGGYGLVNNMEPRGIHFEKYLVLELGYGGLEFEYIANSQRLIHYSIYTLIGGGNVTYRERDRPYEEAYVADGFFVAEPGVSFELNVTKFFRVGLGTSYRYINGVNLEGTSNSELQGLSANLTLKFGKF
jgi:hypothetical protein